MPTATKRKRESTADKASRLAAERGRLAEAMRYAVDGQAVTDECALDMSPQAVWSEWQRVYGRNPFLSRQFINDLSRPSGVFCEDNALSTPVPPQLPAVPSPDEFGKLRQACGVPVEVVAERFEVTPEMLTAWEAGDESVRPHIDQGRLLRLGTAFAVAAAAGGIPAPEPPQVVPDRPEAVILMAESWNSMLAALNVPEDTPRGVVRFLGVVARGEIPTPVFSAIPAPSQIAAAFDQSRQFGVTREWVATVLDVPVTHLRQLEENPGPAGLLVEADHGGAQALLRILAVLALLAEHAVTQ